MKKTRGGFTTNLEKIEAEAMKLGPGNPSEPGRT
jgi:hypothetical protein